jgi:hypothetical protein
MLVHRLQEHFVAATDTDDVRPVLLVDDSHEIRPDVLGVLRIVTNFATRRWRTPSQYGSRAGYGAGHVVSKPARVTDFRGPDGPPHAGAEADYLGVPAPTYKRGVFREVWDEFFANPEMVPHFFIYLQVSGAEAEGVTRAFRSVSAHNVRV